MKSAGFVEDILRSRRITAQTAKSKCGLVWLLVTLGLSGCASLKPGARLSPVCARERTDFDAALAEGAFDRAGSTITRMEVQKCGTEALADAREALARARERKQPGGPASPASETADTERPNAAAPQFSSKAEHRRACELELGRAQSVHDRVQRSGGLGPAGLEAPLPDEQRAKLEKAVEKAEEICPSAGRDHYLKKLAYYRDFMNNARAVAARLERREQAERDGAIGKVLGAPCPAGTKLVGTLPGNDEGWPSDLAVGCSKRTGEAVKDGPWLEGNLQGGFHERGFYSDGQRVGLWEVIIDGKLADVDVYRNGGRASDLWGAGPCSDDSAVQETLTTLAAEGSSDERRSRKVIEKLIERSVEKSGKTGSPSCVELVLSASNSGVVSDEFVADYFLAVQRTDPVKSLELFSSVEGKLGTARDLVFGKIRNPFFFTNDGPQRDDLIFQLVPRKQWLKASDYELRARGRFFSDDVEREFKFMKHHVVQESVVFRGLSPSARKQKARYLTRLLELLARSPSEDVLAALSLRAREKQGWDQQTIWSRPASSACDRLGLISDAKKSEVRVFCYHRPPSR